MQSSKTTHRHFDVRVRALLLVLAGAALPWCGLAMTADESFAHESVAVWATDRAAHRLLGLDRDLFVRREITVRRPVEVEPAPDGGAWVLSALEEHPLGDHRLIRIAADGEVLIDVPAGVAVDLSTIDARDALVVRWDLQGGAEPQVSRVEPDGAVHPLASLPGLVCAAGRDGVVAAAGSTGEVWLLDAISGAVIAVNGLGGQIADVAPGPEPGTFWALDVAAPGRLVLLASDLSVTWAVTTNLNALHLVPDRRREAVWLADSTQPFCRRYGPGGVVEVERSDLPLSGLDRGLSWLDGGVLLAAPGAVLHLGPDGADLPGQGGFDFLVDLAGAR